MTNLKVYGTSRYGLNTERTDRAEVSLHGADDDTGLYSCAASSSAVKVSTGPRARAHRVKPTILGTKPSSHVIGGRYLMVLPPGSHLQCRLQIRTTPVCERDRCLLSHMFILVQVLKLEDGRTVRFLYYDILPFS